MDKNTIIRLIVLVIALINQTLTALGKNPIPYSEDTVYELVSILVTIGISCWTAWKNNNVSEASRLSQKVLNGIKDGTITAEKVEKLIKGTK